MNEVMLAQLAGGEGPSPFGPAFLMLAILGIFYVVLIRPQQKREREKEEFRNRLKKGDEVTGAGGLFGRVVEIRGSVVMLEVAPNVRVRVERRTVEPLSAARPAKPDEKEGGAPA
jgi:preprotein translocase subunit YajC